MVLTKISAKIEEMHCKKCQESIKQAISEVTGVVAVRTDSQIDVTQVTYDSSILSYRDINNAVKLAGFKISYYFDNKVIK